MHVDLTRCCRSILHEGVAQGWPLICAQDAYVPATAANAATLDYIWVDKPAPKTASKQLWMLPFQGSRFYHVSAVELLLRTNRITYAHLGAGFRASGRLSPDS